jgi:hypothetical protein
MPTPGKMAGHTIDEPTTRCCCVDWTPVGAGQTEQVITSRTASSSAPAGYRFAREVIAVAVRWYLRAACQPRCRESNPAGGPPSADRGPADAGLQPADGDGARSFPRRPHGPDRPAASTPQLRRGLPGPRRSGLRSRSQHLGMGSWPNPS